MEFGMVETRDEKPYVRVLVRSDHDERLEHRNRACVIMAIAEDTHTRTRTRTRATQSHVNSICLYNIYTRIYI